MTSAMQTKPANERVLLLPVACCLFPEKFALLC